MKENKFTMSLALVDAIPVVFFLIGVIKIFKDLGSIVFLLGGLCSVVAGLGKVVWKIFLAVKQKDISLFQKQFRILMPTGFVLMLIGFFTVKTSGLVKGLLYKFFRFPSLLFVLIGICAMIGMTIMAKKMDQRDPSSNWKEQITNIVGQGAFMIAILLV